MKDNLYSIVLVKNSTSVGSLGSIWSTLASLDSIDIVGAQDVGNVATCHATWHRYVAGIGVFEIVLVKDGSCQLFCLETTRIALLWQGRCDCEWNGVAGREIHCGKWQAERF